MFSFSMPMKVKNLCTFTLDVEADMLNFGLSLLNSIMPKV